MFGGHLEIVRHPRPGVPGLPRGHDGAAAAGDRHGAAFARARPGGSGREPDHGRRDGRHLPRRLLDRAAPRRAARRPLRPQARADRRTRALHPVRPRQRARAVDRRAARLPPVPGRRRRRGRHLAARDRARPVRRARVAAVHHGDRPGERRRAGDRPEPRRAHPLCRAVAGDLSRARRDRRPHARPRPQPVPRVRSPRPPARASRPRPSPPITRAR